MTLYEKIQATGLIAFLTAGAYAGWEWRGMTAQMEELQNSLNAVSEKSDIIDGKVNYIQEVSTFESLGRRVDVLTTSEYAQYCTLHKKLLAKECPDR